MPASFNPTDAADPQWFSSGRYDALYIEAYELALAPEVISRKIFRFEKIIVLIKSASLDYLEMAGVKIKFGQGRQVEMSAEHRVSTSEFSPKLITIQPHQRSDTNLETELAERSSEYVSLLVSTNYRNIACRRLFAQIAGAQDGSIAAGGAHMRLPFDLPAPDLSAEVLSRFPRCREKIDRSDSARKQKISLSLHWYIKGVQADGLDSFLSLWIALETLTMTSTNVSEMNAALGAAYGMDPVSASVEFGAGRLFGLRSRIVHNGIRKRISTDLTDYMECLYADLLVHELLGESLGRARGLLRSKGIDVQQLTV
jgi:hypothetical protein